MKKSSPLGIFIRERRTALRLSQRKLAKMIGLNAASHLSDVENGFRRLGENYLPALAAALQVTSDDLELHDPRAPLTAAKNLLQSDPRYIMALRRVVKAGEEGMEAEEIIRRMEQNLPVADSNPTTNHNSATEENPS